MIVCENESRSDPPRDERLGCCRALLTTAAAAIIRARDSPSARAVCTFIIIILRAPDTQLALVEKEIPLGRFQVWVSVGYLSCGVFCVFRLGAEFADKICYVMTLHLCLCPHPAHQFRFN
jgi:hypothetical protein